MASVDGSRYLQDGSDEIYEHVCGPCKTDGIAKEARHYCQDCSEYICDACKDYHRKLSVTKNHVILSESKVPASDGKRSGLQIFCNCNTNQEVQYYCGDHQEVVCSPCKTFKHHKCNMTSIQQRSTDYKSSTCASVLSKIKSLRDKYNLLKQQSTGNVSEMKRLKEGCKKDIKIFRKELDTFLNKLEQDMLTELDNYERQEQHRIDEYISTLTTALQLLDLDYKLLEDAKKDGRKEIMFASDVQVTKNFQGYESRLSDLKEDYIKPRISFERNKKLTDLHSDVKALGHLTAQTRTGSQTTLNTGSRSDRKVLLGRTVQSQGHVNVRTRDDENTPGIYGCAVMPNEYMVLCDFNNKRLKLLDNSGVLIKRLTLPCSPWDISVVDSKNVVVTLPDRKQLQYVQVFPQMKAGRTIKLDNKCWGIFVSGDEIYISCHKSRGDGEIRVLDRNGNLKKHLGVRQDGSFIFKRPSYIAVNKTSGKVFVSDWDTRTITCMTVDGRIIYQYRDEDMEHPRGLYCDSEDNILVCGFLTRNLQMITAGGKKYSTLLTSDDGLQYPQSITYRQNDDTLAIGCSARDSVLLFKLADLV